MFVYTLVWSGSAGAAGRHRSAAVFDAGCPQPCLLQCAAGRICPRPHPPMDQGYLFWRQGHTSFYVVSFATIPQSVCICTCYLSRDIQRFVRSTEHFPGAHLDVPRDAVYLPSASPSYLVFILSVLCMGITGNLTSCICPLSVHCCVLLTQ